MATSNPIDLIEETTINVLVDRILDAPFENSLVDIICQPTTSDSPTRSSPIAVIDKSQIVLTLQGLQKSLELWIQQARDYQTQMTDNLEQVKLIIAAVTQYEHDQSQQVDNNDIDLSSGSSSIEQS
ncbi:unnamed protein product [Didymodactylos carnosus]|uniref:Uncharacterized protein n=2 Tax=Didymodactylos carnosus TaxID=1234261 RepID=A0A814YT21_9BILA|nr:unnamed protein product [Didymodactylos carnosus]CAF3995820.1 unnamed protein product [Didymodactylos carnosus]